MTFPIARQDEAPLPPPTIPDGPKIESLAGMAEARAWAEDLARDLALYRASKLRWSDLDPGCVLHGPPGTGKTTFAKALAATCRLPLIATTYGDWQGDKDGHLGSTIAAMQRIFSHAAAHAPCLLFIDELDSIPTRSTNARHAEYWNQIINTFLKEIDKLAETKGVVIVGACNHPGLLDPALVRSGRMDRMIAVTLPSVKELEAIIRFHLTAEERREFEGPFRHGEYRRAAIFSAGMSGADVARHVRNARRLARRKGRCLFPDDYRAAIEQDAPGLGSDILRRVAIHEAGHAVAALKLGMSGNISASIIARNATLGSVAIDRPGVMDFAGLKDLIAVTLAGRAAEEALLGSPSTLAGGETDATDLARATKLAESAVMRYGFTSSAGLVWRTMSDVAVYAEAPAVRALLQEVYERALALVRAHRTYVQAVAYALVSKRVLAHADITALDPDRKPTGGDTGTLERIRLAINDAYLDEYDVPSLPRRRAPLAPLARYPKPSLRDPDRKRS